MTVTAEQIATAKQHLINVDAAARVANKLRLPFYLLCAVITKETGGKNIFGHDSGGAMYGAGEVTEDKYWEFRRLIDAGARSNGVGVMQITYKGFFPIMENRGLKPWVPYDNILYGAELIKGYYESARDVGLSVTESIRRTGTKYNGASAYGDSLVSVANMWRDRVGTADMIPSGAVSFRNGLTCQCVITSLPWVEFDLKLRGLIGRDSSIRIFQLGYRTDVAASAGTHAGGGCIDVAPFNAEVIDVWRQWGWAMQDRSPYFTDDHAHGWPYKCSHLSSAAQQQESDWDRKDAGLSGAALVQGRWPVKPWDQALKERKMALLDDIAKAVVAELKRDTTFRQQVATAVWEKDIIPNWIDPDKNQNLIAGNAVSIIGNQTRGRIGDILAKLDQLLAKL